MTRAFLLAVALLAGFSLAGIEGAGAQTPPPSTSSVGYDMFTAPLREVPERTIDVERLDVVVRVDSANRQVSVALEMGLRATMSNVVQFTWPVRGILVDSVKANVAGADTTLALVRGDSLVVSLAGAMSTTRSSSISIWYHLLPGDALRVSSDPARRGACCMWTGPRWIPLPDDPGDRFQTSLSVTAPRSWTVVAGGRKTRRDGESRFELSRPARVQDLGFAAGQFESRSLDKRLWYLPEGISGSLPRLAGSMGDMLRFMESNTGYRLPWDSLRVVLLPLAAQGYEEISLPGVVGLDVRRMTGPRTYQPDFTEHLAILAARQWSHGVMGTEWWSESWTNEALAGVLALAYIQETAGESASAAARMARLDRYLKESESYQRPLVWDRFDTPEDLQDEHARSKGPLLLFDIRDRLGASSFQSAIRRLVARAAFSDLNSEVLLDALTSSRTPWLYGIFENWVWGAGHPELLVETTWDADSESIRATITQTQTGSIVPAAFPLDTRMDWLLLAGVESAPLSVTEREASWTAPASMAPRFVSFDPDGLLTAHIASGPDLSAIGAILRYSTPYDRLRAARLLPAHRSESAAGLSLRLAYNMADSPEVKAELLRAAADFEGSDSALEILQAGLSDQSIPVRIAALEALARKHSDGTADRQFESVAQRDTIYAVQAAAVRAMSGPGARDLALAALITPSEDHVVLRAGVDVLRRLGGSFREEFLTHTDASLPPDHIRIGLGLAVVAPSDRQTRLRVLALMGHPDVSVRLAAMEAGRTLLRRGNAPAVRDRLKSEWHPTVSNRLGDLAEALDKAAW